MNPPKTKKNALSATASPPLERYDDLLRRVTTLVSDLEKDSLPLDELMARVQDAKQHMAQLRERLQETETQVMSIFSLRQNESEELVKESEGKHES